MPDSFSYSQCLRPEFSQYLVRRLSAGNSLNLVGSEGQGSSRLLEDICTLPDLEAETVLVNMKTCRDSYPRLLHAITEQCGIKSSVNTFQEVLSLLRKENRRIFLLLNHFDAILDNPMMDGRFNIAFFDYLNSLKNMPWISLLIQTEKPHDNALVYVGRRAHSNSWLDVSKEYLTPLAYTYVEDEFKRHLGDHPLWKKYPGSYVNKVLTHKEPYWFMQHIIAETLQYPQPDANISKLFSTWKRSYKKVFRAKHAGKKVQNFWVSLEKFLILTRLKRLQKDSS